MAGSAARFGQLSEREVRDGIRHFWAYCTYLDELFGQLLAALDATGQRENTLVLYTSDHGDYCGEHGLFAKGIPCFQGAYRVPRSSAGRRASSMPAAVKTRSSRWPTSGRRSRRLPA